MSNPDGTIQADVQLGGKVDPVKEATINAMIEAYKKNQEDASTTIDKDKLIAELQAEKNKAIVDPRDELIKGLLDDKAKRDEADKSNILSQFGSDDQEEYKDLSLKEIKLVAKAKGIERSPYAETPKTDEISKVYETTHQEWDLVDHKNVTRIKGEPIKG